MEFNSREDIFGLRIDQTGQEDRVLDGVSLHMVITGLILLTSLAKRIITPTPLVIILSAAKANITMFVIHRRKNSPLIRT